MIEDGSELFYDFCEIYKRADRSYMAGLKFMGAIEWLMRRKKMTDIAAYQYLTEKAKRYCQIVPPELQQNLLKWLEQMTFENPEESWPTGKKAFAVSATPSRLRIKGDD